MEEGHDESNAEPSGEVPSPSVRTFFPGERGGGAECLGCLEPTEGRGDG